jgi:hypothetical protein
MLDARIFVFLGCRRSGRETGGIESSLTAIEAVAGFIVVFMRAISQVSGQGLHLRHLTYRSDRAN